MASFLHAGLEVRSRRFYGVLISFREWLHSYCARNPEGTGSFREVLISFREWLHSYLTRKNITAIARAIGSHLFQRVASFLLVLRKRVFYGFRIVLISFREWLHSYTHHSHSVRVTFTLVLISFREWLHSYGVGVPTAQAIAGWCSHLFQRVASFLQQSSCIKGTCKREVLISFREWLHSYAMMYLQD